MGGVYAAEPQCAVARKDLLMLVSKLLLLLAVESHHRGQSRGLKSFAESLITALALNENEAEELRSLVEGAAWDGKRQVVVTVQDRTSDFVVVRQVTDLIGELLCDVKLRAPVNPAWLVLALKVLITSQVACNCYDAHARASYKRMVRALGLVTWRDVARIEARLAAHRARLIQDGDVDPHNASATARYVKVALAAVGGGALLMYTGAVAAPSIASSLLALCSAATGGGATTALAQITTTATELFAYWGLSSTSAISGIFAATGAGMTGYKMSRRIRGLTEFHLIPLHSELHLEQLLHEQDVAARRAQQTGAAPPLGLTNSVCGGCPGLPVFVCIPGWVEEGQDPRQVWGGAGAWTTAPDEPHNAEDKEEGVLVVKPTRARSVRRNEAEGNACDLDASWEALELENHGWWRDCVPAGEEHVLVWERRVLSQLHKVMKEFLWSEAQRMAIDELIKHTALATLTSAAALPMSVLDAARKLDNPWSMAIAHSEQAGEVLADVLASRPQGSRPVTLMGFSMGARVVFHCLEALYRKGDAAAGIVENAVLLGAPVCKSMERWRAVRSVVAGRLINGYSTKDWALMFLFRSKAWELGLAGLSRVDGCAVENVDLTDVVTGHLAYPRSLPNIIARLQLEV